MARSWYAFIGGGNPNTVSNYYKIPHGTHTCLCGPILCAIYAIDTENTPYPQEPLSENIQQYIKKALVTGQLQPDIPYDAKKYVYLRH